MLSTVSVIIPCKNEEKYISLCLDSLLAQRRRGYDLEIIVVDNGSTDKTPEILERYKSLIEVYSMPYISISEVRNYGAERSSGEWLAFVDADVEVDPEWCQGIENTLDILSGKGFDISKIITGSTCSIPEKSTWVERIWFQQLIERDQKSSRYINGANLVIHRSLYDTVGGFNPKYITGEDEKFCEDIRACGGIIMKANSIRAVHHGYPKSVDHFFRRERWHGLGMKQYFSVPWKSKDLCLALYLLCILFFIPVPSILYMGIIPGMLLTLLLIFVPLFMFAFLRCRMRIKRAAPLTWLYIIYGLARLFSLLDIIWPSPKTGSRFKESTETPIRNSDGSETY